MTLPEGFVYNCGNCKRARLTGLPTCDAFPAFIPYEIYSSDGAHLHTVEGDNGIQYEPNNYMTFILTGVYPRDPLQHIGESQWSAERRERNEKNEAMRSPLYGDAPPEVIAEFQGARK